MSTFWYAAYPTPFDDTWGWNKIEVNPLYTVEEYILEQVAEEAAAEYFNDDPNYDDWPMTFYLKDRDRLLGSVVVMLDLDPVFSGRVVK
jgi:hypothetical protein